MATAQTNELGFQHAPLAGWGLLSNETHEDNPDLQWPNSLDTFDRMRREDPQVASVLRAVMLPIQRTGWMIDPAGCDNAVVQFVASNLDLPIKGVPYVAPVRKASRFSWNEHLRLALLALVFGHSYFEQVYEIVDGQARLRKLAWRPPRTISKIDVAKDGGLTAIEQGAVAGVGGVRIPVDRLVAYVNDREGSNWYGQSLLRPAYKMWLLKDRTLRIQALTADRNGLGMPSYTSAPIPDGLDADAAEKWVTDEIERGLAIAKGARAGDAAGMSMPHGATFEFKGVAGDLPDTAAAITYYDQQIGRAVLANFLQLGGSDSKGSYALSDVLGDFFTASLNTVALWVADVVNQHVIEDLVDLNYGSTVRAPLLVPATIGAEHPATAEAIKALIDARAITPDPSLEAHLRVLYGLPVKDEADQPTPAEEAA